MYKKSWVLARDERGIGIVIVAVVVAVLLIAIGFFALAAYGVIQVPGITPGYLPPEDNPNTNTKNNTIKGYLDANVVVRYINPEGYYNPMTFSFKAGSLSGTLIAVPVAAQFWKMLDWTSYSLQGVVKFQLSNPQLLYNPPLVSITYKGNIGNAMTSTQITDIDIQLSGYALGIREHGTYLLTAFLYDGANPNKIADTISINVDL